MARRYPSNLKFLFKLHSRSRHCYGPTSEPRFSIKHRKVSPHSNSESHLPRYGDRFINHDIFSSEREGFSNCSKGNTSEEQESRIGKGNLPVYRNVLDYSPCSKGSSNPLLTASTPSDNLTERKFTFKKPMPLSESHTSLPCHARSGLVDTQSLPPPDISIQTDASNLGWGGYLKPLRTSGMWTRSQLFWHINRKELMAIFLSLKFFLKSQENVHVQIMTDNSTSVSYLNEGGTKSVTLSNLALDIWRWCLQKAIHISAVHVAGLLNIFADPLSRFQLMSTEWMLCKRIFRQIVAVYRCPQIDLFASYQNHQLKTYCSWIADPKTLKIDAFTFSWDFNLVYLFPPFPLIHKCLSKIKKNKCRAILIAPVWKSKPWYPIILGMLMDRPALLPIRKDLLQLPLSNQTHPLLTDRKRNFKLAAWPVSGNPSDSIKFLKWCPKLSLHHGGRVQESITTAYLA